MLASILGKRLRWTLPSGWIFEPAIVGPDTVDYVLKCPFRNFLNRLNQLDSKEVA